MWSALEWKDEYSLGIETVDLQHEELFSRINRLLGSMVRHESREEIGEMIRFLEDYVEVHFEYEEGYMAHHKYPHILIHKRQHEIFIADYAVLKSRFTEMGASTLVGISIQKAIDWLINHITRVDKVFADFMKKKVVVEEVFA